jgi:hypothetical protein
MTRGGKSWRFFGQLVSESTGKKLMMKNFARRALILTGLLLILISPNTNPLILASEDFTIVVLPDTQFYSCGLPCGSDPSIFSTQTKWIVDNRESLNIVYVIHVGDIVEHPDHEWEWENASDAMSLLEDQASTGQDDGIPYGVVPGNHDIMVYKDYLIASYGSYDESESFKTYFGSARFKGRSYYGGYCGENSRSNYTLFRAGGMDFIVINLDYHPKAQSLTWANARLKECNNRQAIVVSHHILSLHGFSAPGRLIYDALKDNPNLFLMVCGHIHGEARRTDTFKGNSIHTLLADYQEIEKGGNGWLRILEFSPESKKIHVKTYSPTLDQYQKDSDSQFTLQYDVDAMNIRK